MQSFGGNVEKIVWQGNELAGNVRDNTKGDHWPIQHSSVQLTGNIHATVVAQDHNEESEVVGPHLMVESLFNSGIAYENQGTPLEVKVADCMIVLLLETLHSKLVKGHNLVSKVL
jgi:hypothetical protein